MSAAIENVLKAGDRDGIMARGALLAEALTERFEECKPSSWAATMQRTDKKMNRDDAEKKVFTFKIDKEAQTVHFEEVTTRNKAKDIVLSTYAKHKGNLNDAQKKQIAQLIESLAS